MCNRFIEIKITNYNNLLRILSDEIYVVLHVDIYT